VAESEQFTEALTLCEWGFWQNYAPALLLASPFLCVLLPWAGRVECVMISLVDFSALPLLPALPSPVLLPWAGRVEQVVECYTEAVEAAQAFGPFGAARLSW